MSLSPKIVVLAGLFTLLAACAKSPDAPRPSTGATAAQTASLTPGNGFYAAQNPNVPAPIAQAEASVFRVKILGLSSLNHAGTYDVSGGKGPAVLAQIEQNFPISNADTMDHLIIRRQIEHCGDFSDDDQKHCIVTFELYGGTAFVTGDGSTLWTNAHILDPYVSANQKFGKVTLAQQIQNQQPVRLFIFDQNNQLMIDPYNEKIVLLAAPVATAQAIAQNKFYADDCDYFTLKLPRPLAAPLVIAQTAPVAGQLVYIVGFPACTACDSSTFSGADPVDFTSRAPAPDSDGVGMKITSGLILDRSGVEGFIQASLSLLAQTNFQQMLFSTADSNDGNSGSPVLNANGEVMAIHTGGKSRLQGTTFMRMSRAVIPPNFPANSLYSSGF